MKNITTILCNPNIKGRICQFYINAKVYKYKDSYAWKEVFNDIRLAYLDRLIVPTNKTIRDWMEKGFNVARNNKGWAFAYTIEGDTMYIHDAENCKYLTMDYQNTERFVFVGNKYKYVERYTSIRYGIFASCLEDGYIYLFKNGQQLPNYRFNEILKPFYKYKNGEIYAIGLYGNKKYKITLDGIARTLMEMKQQEIIHKVMTEMIDRKLRLLAS